MTTARPTTGAFLVTALVGALMVLLAAALSGSAAATAALVGTTIVCLFFALGAVVLQVVSGLMPAASLLVALLTYTLKVVLLALVFVALSRSAAFSGPAESRWLAAAVIAGTLTWTVSQLVLHVRTRQPLYDLPQRGSEASAR